MDEDHFVTTPQHIHQRYIMPYIYTGTHTTTYTKPIRDTSYHILLKQDHFVTHSPHIPQILCIYSSTEHNTSQGFKQTPHILGNLKIITLITLSNENTETLKNILMDTANTFTRVFKKQTYTIPGTTSNNAPRHSYNKRAITHAETHTHPTTIIRNTMLAFDGDTSHSSNTYMDIHATLFDGGLRLTTSTTGT